MWGLIPRLGGSQGVVLAQDLDLELAQVWRRIDAKLICQERADLAEAVQRVGLPARAIEGDHQLSPSTLTERLLAHEGLKIRDGLGVMAGREFRVDQILLGRIAKLLQPPHIGIGESLPRNVFQGRSSPESKRFSKKRAGGFCVSAR